MTFLRPSLKFKHIKRVHEGIKQNLHECDVCHKKISTKGDLLRHKNSVHEGQKFKCSLCDAMYGLKSNLNRHIKRTHDGKKESLKCTLCGITFLNYYRKVKHFKSVHQSIYIK